MKAINLFMLTRTHDAGTVSMLFHALSQRADRKPVSEHEAASLWQFTDRIFACLNDREKDSDKNRISFLDGFFFSYVIEHIGKEFDLLKISRDGSDILNVELKSEKVDDDRIRRQLEQNRYYLSHIARTIWSFTYVMETNQLYQMNEKGYLRTCGMEELADVLMRDAFRDYLPDGIDSFFKAADYLISPVASPGQFLAGQYFLTNQQFDFRRRILSCLKNGGGGSQLPVIGVSGIAGTGKTLLLLDLSLQLSKKQKVLFVHSGPLRKGHQIIDQRLKNVDIIDKSFIRSAALSGYAYLLIDEADHLEEDILSALLYRAKECRVPTVLSYDPHELLFESENSTAGNNAVSLRFNRICTLVLSFTGNIRINRPVYSFLRTLLSRNDRPGRHDYSCIDVVYADGADEAELISGYYKDRDYVLVSDRCGAESGDDVIAWEYDKVMMILDDSFFYDESGRLHAAGDENKALCLLYEGLSRTRENLCLLITGKRDLFEAVLAIRLQ